MPLTLAATNNNDDFFGGVRDFFHSTTWSIIETLLIAFALIFWLSVAFWVVKDARRRIGDPWLVGIAALLGLVPIVGVLVYLLFRPPEYLDDVRERALEISEMEQRLSEQNLNCPVCRARVDPSFLVCPVCTTKLKQACRGCKAPLEPIWQVCPYCETPIDTPASLELGAAWEAAAAPQRRTRRRR
jgi:Double zinc ribbon